MNRVLVEDIKDFVSSFVLAEELHNASFLVTGGTGLIGSLLIRCLLALNKNIHVIAPVRNRVKAETLYTEYASNVKILECDLLTFDYDTVGDVDYIVHCAAPTASRFFVNHAVETFHCIVQGTTILLEYAKKHKVKSFVYLSSLEVYGNVKNDSEVITEEQQGYLNPMSLRSSYPMAKRAAETLCHLYAKEFHVPVKIARLTQTTGAGIARDDNRVIAQFARLTAEGKDIVLHTTGESARPYCYTMDAISAILYILLRGADGEAYNVANEETYISAMGMAHFLREEFCPQLDVRVELNDNMGYAPPTKLRLGTDKLQALGWRPQYGLRRIFNQLIEYLKSS